MRVWRVRIVIEEIKTHILCSIISFFENLIFFFIDNVKKYFRAGQATDESMAHAYCMLDT